MKNKEKIIRYIDEQMNPGEKFRFEEELKKSPSLKNEVEASKRMLNQFRDSGDIQSGDYFNNLLPRFRKKEIKENKFKFKPAAALAAGALSVIILFSIIFRQDDSQLQKYQNIITTLNEDEVRYFLNSYSNNTSEFISNNQERYDSVLTEIIAQELTSENPDLNYIFDNAEINYGSRLITDKDADLVYDEIINKKFF
jgi:hypothetical protein